MHIEDLPHPKIRERKNEGMRKREMRGVDDKKLTLRGCQGERNCQGEKKLGEIHGNVELTKNKKENNNIEKRKKKLMVKK